MLVAPWRGSVGPVGCGARDACYFSIPSRGMTRRCAPPLPRSRSRGARRGGDGPRCGAARLRRGQSPGVGGVERLDAGLVVAVERRDGAVGPEAEVVVGGIGEPHPDLVEVDAHALAVDGPARERLVDDEVKLVVRGFAPAGGEVPLLSRGAERGSAGFR